MFFSHNKSANSASYHDLSVKQTIGHQMLDGRLRAFCFMETSCTLDVMENISHVLLYMIQSDMSHIDLGLV